MQIITSNEKVYVYDNSIISSNIASKLILNFSKKFVVFSTSSKDILISNYLYL